MFKIASMNNVPRTFFSSGLNLYKKALSGILGTNTSCHFGTCLLFILPVLLLITGCRSSKVDKDKEKTYVIYPIPPEPPKIQFLTKITSSKDLEKKQGAFSKFLLGDEKPKGIVKPYGLAINKGKIYVCDPYGGGMEIIDLEKGTLDFFHPKGKGQLRNPINCFVDEKGYLYVADGARFEIVVYDEKGNYVRSFGEKEKFKPTDVFVSNDSVFVVNLPNNQVVVYLNDSTNKLLYTFPENEPGTPGFLCSPINLTLSSDRVYVSDFGCPSIKVFTHKGQYLDTIGTQGDYPGQFSKIKGIAVDKESNIYAVDAAFENVQVFNKEGKLLIVFAGHYAGPGDLIIPAKVIIDYDNLKYFQKYVDPQLDLKYLIFVTSQYGPDLINVYGRVEAKAKAGK